MTKEEAKAEIRKVFEPAFANYIITALTEGATPSERKSKWIPVTERLPEEKKAVLVWCPQYKNIYCACMKKEQWWIFGSYFQIILNGVVAWMPLPEQPHTRSEEEIKNDIKNVIMALVKGADE